MFKSFNFIFFVQADTSILEAETILTSLQGEPILTSLQSETILTSLQGEPNPSNEGVAPLAPSLGVEGALPHPHHLPEGEISAGVPSLLSPLFIPGEGKGVDPTAREPVSLGKFIFATFFS